MMHVRKAFIVSLFVSIVFGGFAHSVDAKTTPAMRIFYYQDGKNAFASFSQHLKSIDVIAPQSYALDAAGTLRGSLDPDVAALAKKNAIKIMPLVTNAGFKRATAEAFLDDTVAQAGAITALTSEALDQGFWGWQMDFENIDVAYRDRYSQFIKNASEALRKNNLTLSVAVIAQTSSDPSDYPKDSWQYIVGVYDYASLSSNADFLSIMAYDDPGSHGPVARYAWIQQVLTYALQFIPSAKLSLGIPLYYWQWNTATGKRVGIGGYHGIQNVLNAHVVARGYSAMQQAAFIQYRNKKRHYIIWYENTKSLTKKFDLIHQYHLAGFSAWALGLESPDVYQALRALEHG